MNENERPPANHGSESTDAVATSAVREGVGRLVRRAGRDTRPTAFELLGVVGVVVGFGLLGGPAGVVVALAVALLWYAFSGVYGFAAGQFMLAAVLPARIGLDLLTPELVAVEAALILVLVGGDHRDGASSGYRRLLRTGVVGVLLGSVALGVGVGSAPVADETLVVVAVSVAFLVAASTLYVWGRIVVSPIVDDSVGGTGGGDVEGELVT